MRISKTLSDEIYASLIRRISEGELPQGELLPREEDLANSLNVSRTVLREALARLRHEGVIDTKRGTGNRVIGPPAPRGAAIFEADGPNSVSELQDCFEFRLGLEPEIAAAAARNANRSDLMLIEETAASLERAVDGDELGAVEDIAFHTAIASASHNSFYLRTITAIARPVEIGMQIARTLSVGRQGDRPGDRLTTTIAEHRAILDAIRAGNEAQARNAMRTHLGATLDRVFRGKTR